MITMNNTREIKTLPILDLYQPILLSIPNYIRYSLNVCFLISPLSLKLQYWGTVYQLYKWNWHLIIYVIFYQYIFYNLFMYFIQYRMSQLLLYYWSNYKGSVLYILLRHISSKLTDIKLFLLIILIDCKKSLDILSLDNESLPPTDLDRLSWMIT